MDTPSQPRRKNITEILVEAGAVTPEQVDVALVRQRETGRRIGEALVELGFVSEQDIGWALAHQLGIPFVDVQPDTLDVELVRSFPDGALRRLHVVPLFRSEGRVTAAVADPTDQDAMDELERLCDSPASCVAATPSAIESVLDEILGRPQGARARVVETPPDARFDVLWEPSGETFLDFHLSQARRLGTDEVHFETVDGWLLVRHRAATRLHEVAREPAAVMDVLLARLESLGMKPLGGGDGHRSMPLSCPVAGESRGLRASVLSAGGRVSVTLRLLGDHEANTGLDALGLEPLDVSQLREILHEPSGLVLVAGPNGSGGSTTLGALLAESPADDRRWAVFARDRRRWFGTSGRVDVVSGPARAHWRRIALEHALDGVVVDGGLDGRRVLTVLDGAMHGRWVLARTDWEDTFALLERLQQAPAGRSSLARRLRAVIQQRLVATPHANAVTTGEWLSGNEAVAANAASGAPDVPLRRAVFEVLLVGDAIRDALCKGAGAEELRAIARASGFHSLSDSLKAGVQRGRLDPRDAARALA